jgi:hypothetical protein
MADSATTKAAADAVKNARNAIVDQLKKDGILSLKLGAGVTIVAFGVLTTLVAAQAAIGAGEGVVDGIKSFRARS